MSIKSKKQVFEVEVLVTTLCVVKATVEGTTLTDVDVHVKDDAGNMVAINDASLHGIGDELETIAGEIGEEMGVEIQYK